VGTLSLTLNHVNSRDMEGIGGKSPRQITSKKNRLSRRVADANRYRTGMKNREEQPYGKKVLRYKNVEKMIYVANQASKRFPEGAPKKTFEGT